VAADTRSLRRSQSPRRACDLRRRRGQKRTRHLMNHTGHCSLSTVRRYIRGRQPVSGERGGGDRPLNLGLYQLRDWWRIVNSPPVSTELSGNAQHQISWIAVLLRSLRSRAGPSPLHGRYAKPKEIHLRRYIQLKPRTIKTIKGCECA
jgi:hypothetical protein